MIQQFREIDSVLDDAVAARHFETQNKEDLVFALLLLQNHILYDDREPLAKVAKHILNRVILPAYHFRFLSTGGKSSIFSDAVAMASPWAPSDTQFEELGAQMRKVRSDKSIPVDPRNEESARLQARSIYRRKALISDILHSGKQNEVWDMICSAAPHPYRKLYWRLAAQFRPGRRRWKQGKIVLAIDQGIRQWLQFPIQLAHMIPQILDSIRNQNFECSAVADPLESFDQALSTKIAAYEPQYTFIWGKGHHCPQCALKRCGDLVQES
jgi:hypothetical protein